MGLFRSTSPSATEELSPTSTVATGFDRMRVPDESGAHRWLTRKEFEGLSLVDRVRLLAAGQLEFFRGDQRVRARDAMGS